MSRSLLYLALLGSLVECLSLAKRYTNSSTPGAPLRFNVNGTFQISIMEDLHFGENAWDTWGPQQDINSVEVIKKVLDKESPSLVVLNGDLITGDNGFLENSTIYLEQIVAPLVQRNLPWASAYGNHDHQYNLSTDALLEHEQRWPNAMTKNMVESEDAGTSNYYLPIYPNNCTTTSAAAEKCIPELILWFFDSRGGFQYQKKDASGNRLGLPNWVDISVVRWFQQTHAVLTAKYQKTIPSLAFVHIPTYASVAFQTAGVSPHYQPGINDDVPVSPQAQGWCANGTNDRNCDYGGQDVPFMQALTTLPGIIAVFSGHDHGDTWCAKWNTRLPGMTVAGNGINLCFGQHTGYGGYGNWERGSRQIKVSMEQLRDFEVESWIRLESGHVVGSVGLNATYGRDWYPATNNTKTNCPTCNYTIVTPGPGS
ncbi:Metallo-dependent phosphatase [Periconia macrospinosa]|uniref:Metallo-dependent phosphatase n=1 Tax=Periconia macrospinosa TaxID=97972 RepID=A0A2V1E5I0_9PLEO|nr:Metallo-dependent phosphatase [Periconia macrospinosa]